MEEGQEEKPKKRSLFTYVYFGLMFGIALGTALHNIAIGFVLGAAAGYVYYQYKVKSDKKNNNNNEPDKE